MTIRLSLISLLLSPVISTAQMVSKESDWLDLTDEPSRSELIQMHDKSLVIPPQFTFPEDSLVDRQRNETRKNQIFGIDLSHHNKSGLPFEILKDQNIHFVYVKATQGVGYKDPKFAEYWSKLDTLPPQKKVFRGAYHFLSASEDPLAQANRFVAYVNLHGGFKSEDLPPVVDLEWDMAKVGQPDRWSNLKPEQILQALSTFLMRVEQLTGRTPMIYTARSWWRDRHIPEEKIKMFSRHPIWIADYSRRALASEKPAVINDVPYGLWQFSESAKLSGSYRDSLDANVFKGTESDFLRTFGIGRNADMKCGPDSSGEEFVWLDTKVHNIWISKMDDLATAFPLTTRSWTRGTSRYSIDAKATIHLGPMQADANLTVTPLGNAGSLILEVRDADGPLDPVPCRDFSLSEAE